MAKLNVVKAYCTKNRCYQQAVKRTPIGIQIHTIGTAQGTAQAVRDYWNQSGVSALVHYVCDSDTPGKVLYLLPEEYFSWADGGYGNRNLITIEVCESDFMYYTSGSNYVVTNQKAFEADVMRGYDTAVQLCADICRRYNWNPMSKLPSGLYLVSSHDEGRIAGLSTAHVDPSHLWPKLGLSMDTFRRAVANALKKGTTEIVSDKKAYYYRVRKTWKDAQSQLGAYEILANAKKNCPVGYSVFDEDGKAVYSNKVKVSGTQASAFAKLTETKAAEKILELVNKTDKSGILNSVTAAQMILESGYVKTKLATSANNCFGMKINLSGNTWSGSTWDQKTSVPIVTREVYDGVETYVTASFRSYPCIEDSIKDHAAYLLGAMNGDEKRYAGLTKAKNYTEAITIIKNGGYATDPNYISKLSSIIMRFGLDAYDPKATTPKQYYRVAADYKNGRYIGQVGAYTVLENAMRRAQETGLTLFNPDGTKYWGPKPPTLSDVCAYMNRTMEHDVSVGLAWVYSNNRKFSDTFEEARTGKNRYCNCARMVVWALKETGDLPENAAGFYGKKGGSIVYKSSATREAILKAYNIIKIGGKKTVDQLIKAGDLKANDIVTYYTMNHTNLYVGDGMWYDAGHAYMADDNYKTWHGKTVVGSEPVGCIMRRKE